jgi:hypothetical protein
MVVNFCLDHGGEEIFTIETEDVAGLLAAAQGDKITYLGDLYRYDNHVLSYHVDNGRHYYEVNVYMTPY